MLGLAWLIILVLQAGVGCLPVHGGEWPEGVVPWILLPCQLSLTEVVKVGTVAKPRSWCPLEQMVLPAGHHLLWLAPFLGSPSVLSAFLLGPPLHHMPILFLLTPFGANLHCVGSWVLLSGLSVSYIFFHSPLPTLSRLPSL